MNSKLITVAIILIIFLVLYFVPIGIYLTARISGIKISIFSLTGIKFRRSPVGEIVNGLLMAKKADLDVKKEDIEAIALAGGNIRNIIYGMIAAKKLGHELSFRQASEEDLTHFATKYH